MEHPKNKLYPTIRRLTSSCVQRPTIYSPRDIQQITYCSVCMSSSLTSHTIPHVSWLMHSALSTHKATILTISGASEHGASAFFCSWMGLLCFGETTRMIGGCVYVFNITGALARNFDVVLYSILITQ